MILYRWRLSYAFDLHFFLSTPSMPQHVIFLLLSFALLKVRRNMTEETNIQPIQPDFEQIKKTDEDGREYWSAREVATALGYSTWQKFNRVLNKALQVA